MRKDKITIGDWRYTLPIVEAVNDVLRSGRLTYGKYSREFESRFSRMHGCEYGVLSNSGTSSLQVAIQALKEIHGWNDGDEVIIPAVTFVATANAVSHNNLVPVPVDVDEYTYNIDVGLVYKAITNKTKLILPVHLFGQPANMAAINEIANIYNLKVIEDSCEAVLATHHGQTVGSMSDIGVFSFYMSHILTAGVGGMATTNNPLYAKKMRQLINHGWDRRERPIDSPAFDVEEIRSRYYFSSVGHSYRSTEINAAIGVSQLIELPDAISERNYNALCLTRMLSGTPEIRTPTIMQENTHSFMMYPIVVLDEDKWGLVEHLERNGIETREMLPLVGQPIYPQWKEDDYPVAARINKSGLYVGCHQYLDEYDMEKIATSIKEYFGG